MASRRRFSRAASWRRGVPLVEGPNTVTATARDFCGNESMDTVAIELEGTPPELSASVSKVCSGVVHISGTASDLHSAVRVSVEGPAPPVQLFVAADGTFSGPVTVPEGLASLAVVAVDAAGNESRQTFELQPVICQVFDRCHTAGMCDFAGMCGLPVPTGAASCNGCGSVPGGLTAWWPGDATPADVLEAHGATLRGDATFGAGLVGNAFVLDGEGDFVDVAHDASLNVGTGDFSLSLWGQLQQHERRADHRREVHPGG